MTTFSPHRSARSIADGELHEFAPYVGDNGTGFAECFGGGFKKLFGQVGRTWHTRWFIIEADELQVGDFVVTCVMNNHSESFRLPPKGGTFRVLRQKLPPGPWKLLEKGESGMIDGGRFDDYSVPAFFYESLVEEKV